jgi:peptide/nickel transport system permease protein
MSDGTGTAPVVPRLVSTKRAARKLTIFGAIGIALLAVNVGCALFGPIIAPHPPGDITPGGAFAPPSATALLGNDYLSRDLLSRLLDGARFSLGVAGLATGLGFLVGMSIGFSAAEIRGRFDAAVTWAIDVLLSFPPILLALIVIAGLGTSLPVLIGTIAFIQSPRVARVSRAVALGIATLEFVEVARARGEGLAAILLREIFPSAVRPLAVEFGLRLSYAVLFMSSLSFLGLGIQPPEADWGGMVRENLPGLYYGAPASIVPGIMIGLLVLGINLTVDWLSAGADAQISEELR